MLRLAPGPTREDAAADPGRPAPSLDERGYATAPRVRGLAPTMWEEKDAEAAFALVGRVRSDRLLVVLMADGDGVPPKKGSCDAGLSSGNIAGTTMSFSIGGLVSVSASFGWD